MKMWLCMLYIGFALFFRLLQASDFPTKPALIKIDYLHKGKYFDEPPTDENGKELYSQLRVKTPGGKYIDFNNKPSCVYHPEEVHARFMTLRCIDSQEDGEGYVLDLFGDNRVYLVGVSAAAYFSPNLKRFMIQETPAFKRKSSVSIFRIDGDKIVQELQVSLDSRSEFKCDHILKCYKSKFKEVEYLTSLKWVNDNLIEGGRQFAKGFDVNPYKAESIKIKFDKDKGWTTSFPVEEYK